MIKEEKELFAALTAKRLGDHLINFYLSNDALSPHDMIDCIRSLTYLILAPIACADNENDVPKQLEAFNKSVDEFAAWMKQKSHEDFQRADVLKAQIEGR